MALRFRDGRGWAAVAALVLVVGFGGGVARGQWVVVDLGEERIVQTPHYNVRTDLDAEVARAVATQQEVLYLELVRRMGSVRTPREGLRFSVRVLGDRARYEREVGPEAKGTRGIFAPDKNLLACWGAPNELDQILRILRHEGTHQVVRYCIGPQCPVWLNEGLAVFYEHAELQEKGLKVGQIPAGRVASLCRAMDSKKLLPLVRMRDMTNAEWLAAVNSDAPHAGLQYDQAWAMIHFLAYGEKGKYRDTFVQFIYYIARNQEADEAWKRVFGADEKGFEARWCEYIVHLQSVLAGEPAAPPPPAGGHVSECRAQLLVLGLLAVRAHGNPAYVRDMAMFRKAVLSGRLGEWTIKSPDGKLTVRSDDGTGLEALFRCPDDKGADGVSSYELVPNPSRGPPIVRCRHHRGVVLETQYAPDPKDRKKMHVSIVSKPAASAPASQNPSSGEKDD